MRDIFQNLQNYFRLLGQSYGDLDETRTAKQKFQAFI
jgi:hypothetical protein